MAATTRRRGRLIAILAVLALLLIFGVWWFMVRDTAPASVDSVAAAQARQAAIDEAQAQGSADVPAYAASSDQGDGGAGGEGDAGAATQVTLEDDRYGDSEPAPDGDGAQGEAAVVAANPIEGVWTVDTSIGAFDDGCLQEACGTSFVGFRIQEELARVGAKTVVGRTPGVSGSMEIVGTQVIGAEFVADMTALTTDDSTRNGAIRGTSGGLETDAFPEARFELTEPIELGSVPAEGASITVDATGDLTVHGVTRPVTIALTAERQAGLVIVVGSLENLVLTDFDIPKPTSIVVLSVDEVAAMELQLFLSR